MAVATINEAEIITLVNDEFRQLCDRIRENHLRAGQKASGRTAQSIQYEVLPSSGVIRAIAKGRQAFQTLETGRKGGAVPYGFIGIIRQWMQDKGIKASPIPYIRRPSQRWQPKYTPQERGNMSLAGAIAYTIRTRGTSLYRKGGRADIYSSEVQVTIDNISARLSKVFGATIDHIHLNISK